MKKIISMVIVLVLALFSIFSVTVSAETEVYEEPLVTTDFSNTWVTCWDGVSQSERSIVVRNRGLDYNNANYGNFSVYNEIEVVKPEEYYKSSAPIGYRLRKFTDLSTYADSGYVRFWVDVPKDMSLRFTLKSYDRQNDKYSESSVNVAFTVAEEGYQEVRIPLKSFVDANKNWNSTCARYFYVGGIKGCSSETFLGIGEILMVSHFEIWHDVPPEPVSHDATPVYRDINGRFLIKDINGILDKDSIVKGFKNTLEKDNFTEAVKAYNNEAEILELYTAYVVTTGLCKPNLSEDGESYQYKKAAISDFVELYIPVTETMNKNYISVVTCAHGVVQECEFTLTDKYLIIKTDYIESILIIDTNAPLFTADTISTDQVIKTVNDNIGFDEAMFVKKAVSTGNVMLFNEYDTPLADIVNWLKNDEGQLRFWVKTPYRADKPEAQFNITLCARYYKEDSAQYPKNNATITIPLDGEWHEIRISSTEFSSTAFDNIINNETYLASYNAFYIYTSSNVDIEEKEGLYFTNFNFYAKSLMYDKADGMIHKPYLQITNLTQDNSWKTGNTTYVTRSTVACEELPFAGKMVNIKATDSFDIDTYPAGQIGFAYRNGVSTTDFAEWVYYNPRAEMRFWVKSQKDVTFKLELHEGSTGKNITILSTVSVKGSPDWQEVRLRRSDFSEKSSFDNVFISGDYSTCNITMFISDIVSGFSANDSISFAQNIEFFTFEAYSKGDMTLNGTVDALDVVRMKKYIAGQDFQIINADIDSDSKVTATDLVYVRNLIMTGRWK